MHFPQNTEKSAIILIYSKTTHHFPRCFPAPNCITLTSSAAQPVNESQPKPQYTLIIPRTCLANIPSLTLHFSSFLEFIATRNYLNQNPTQKITEQKNVAKYVMLADQLCCWFQRRQQGFLATVQVCDGGRWQKGKYLCWQQIPPHWEGVSVAFPPLPPAGLSYTVVVFVGSLANGCRDAYVCWRIEAKRKQPLSRYACSPRTQSRTMMLASTARVCICARRSSRVSCTSVYLLTSVRARVSFSVTRLCI